MKNTIKLATTLVLFSSVLGSVTTFAADEDKATSTGNVKFIQGGGEGEIVDPEGEKPVKPEEKPGGGGGENQGGLMIDFVPNLDFGSENKIQGKDVTLYAALQQVKEVDENGETPGDAQERPNFIQVSDLRGTFEGWALSVTQTTQFKAGADELTGAELTFANGIVKEKNNTDNMAESTVSDNALSIGSAAPIMSAAVGAGTGSNILTFGTTEGENIAKESVSLKVLEGSQKVDVDYTTELVWNLTNGPANYEA